MQISNENVLFRNQSNIRRNITLSGGIDTDKFEFQTWTYVLMICIGICIFVCDCVTCIAMSRTSRIPFATRFLTCVSLIFDSVFISVIIILTIIKFALGIHLNSYLQEVCVELCRLCIALSWITITLMTIERVICLNFPLYYTTVFDKQRLQVCFSTVLLSCGTLKLLLRYVVVPLYYALPMDFLVLSADLDINTWYLCVCIVVTSVCYVNIHCIIRKKRSHDSTMMSQIHFMASHSSFSSTNASRVLFVIFLSLHIPLFFTYLYTDLISKNNWRRYLPLIWMLIMCVVNPITYAWRYMECRYVLFRMVDRLLGICAPTVLSMRIEVFNIIVSKNKLQVHPKEQTTINSIMP